MEDNKKTLILSIIGILVLVIAVVGVSFAMFSFSGTGTKENIIKTGTITIDFTDDTEDNQVDLDDTYPMDDSKGVDPNTDDSAEFDIKADWGDSPLTIVYDVGITNIQASGALTSEYVKVALLDGAGNVLVGNKDGSNNLTSGVTIASLANVAGPNNIITQYGLTGGTMTTSGSVDSYKVIAYVSSDYTLAIDNANSTSPEVASGTLNNQGGTLHKKTTKTETYSFKVTVRAEQR